MVMTLESTSRVRRRGTGKRCAFTLIELLAVVLVIIMLSAIAVGIATYVQKQTGRATARAQIATIGVALEIYKADWGYYPRTGPERLSADGAKEATNNCTLLNALYPTNHVSGRKTYLNLSFAQIRSNPAPALFLCTNSLVSGNTYTNDFLPTLPNIYDPWGNPYVYYNSPTTPYGLLSVCAATSPPGYNTRKPGTGYTLGGQVNVASYDLFSFGPDRYTYVPGATTSTNCSGTLYTTWANRLLGADNTFYPWTNKNSAVDDITNWGR